MSWIKDRQGAPAVPPGTDPSKYGTHGQPYGNQQNVFPNYQNPPAMSGQQQYWQAQPPQPPPQLQQPQYIQPYGQVYQQDYQANSNQFYPIQNQYSQNYSQFTSQPTHQQSYFPNQSLQQQQQQQQQQQPPPPQQQQQHQHQNQTYQPKPNADGWEDNWDWGWDEVSKQQAQKQNISAHQAASHQQGQVYNNANVLEASFQTGDNWNWTVDDKKQAREATKLISETNEPVNLTSNNLVTENTVLTEPNREDSNVTNPPHLNEDIKTLNDREAVKERLPNLALGKRFHLDNLTPQWSIESQMSQESSDGQHTHSEGTFKSENQSIHSNKSSPGLNTDNSNFNYSGLDEYPQNSEWSKSEELTVADHLQINNGRENYDTLANSMHEMTLSNHENASIVHNSKPLHENTLSQAHIDVPSANLPPPVQSNPNSQAANIMPPPPPVNVPPPSSLPRPPSSSGIPPRPPSNPGSLPRPSSNPGGQPRPPSNPGSQARPPSSSGTQPRPPSSSGMPPRPPSSTSLPRPPSSSSGISQTSNPSSSLPPPPTGSIMAPPSSTGHSTTQSSNLPPTTSTNPFKHAGAFSHKSTTKPAATSVSAAFPPANTNSGLVSPAVVKASQQKPPMGFEANLETTPDNSERPDQPQLSAFRALPISQHVPENLEIAPQNDRNEYLQTAHLSSGDYGENTDFSGNPPLGLRRMVVGQQESEYNQNLNISGDEPPPSFARMVPGQHNEMEHSYNQTGDDYMDRHIDGQPTDNGGRPYRQADGQQTPDNYIQPPSRGTDRRPIGLDRMVPGEPSNDQYQGPNYPQYQSTNYTTHEQRVVTGLDHDFELNVDTGSSDIREQNVDGSDYSEHASRNAQRNVIGSRDTNNDTSVDYGAGREEQQRELTMEGENLQDISAISSVDRTYSREQIFDGANTTLADAVSDRRNDVTESLNHPATSSRRQSLNRVTSGEDSERDRIYKSSPRRDKHKSSRDRERDRDRDREKDSRYSRDHRKYDRDDRRSTRDDRRPEKDRRDRDRDRDRDESPDTRRHRRSTRSRRYETEDTDYYSDREKERRRYREGSYASRGPRAERLRERERERAPRYRDIDPNNKYGSLRRERDDQRRRGENYSSPSRPDSREATATDEDFTDSRRRTRRHRQDPYYDGYGSAAYPDAYALQRRQYSYYEQLRLTDPAAYMQIYKQIMAGQTPHFHPKMYTEEYAAGVRSRSGRDSVHSGRSSAATPARLDTDLNTDASLNLQLDDSTVRSERMTPYLYSTAHVKARLSSGPVVLVRGSYPVDGRPATVQLLSLASALAHTKQADELAHFPGPLAKGVSHKKSVVEYCAARAAAASLEGGRDPLGYRLMWDLLALLLRQNGVVVGSDIAELLMKNTRECEYESFSQKTHGESRRDSSLSGEGRDDETRGSSPELSGSTSDMTMQEPSPLQSVAETELALQRYREYLLCGNRAEALEWAMSNGLWGHALQLAAHSERRTRAAVSARFLTSLPRTDPLHSLYAALAGGLPPALTCAGEPRAGDWRGHCAVLLANPSARPEHDRKILTQLGDSLASRGQQFSAQFCYVSAGLPVSAHPLQPLCPPPGPVPPPGPTPPPRLALLLADPRAATLDQFATNKAIFATEIYEYALSLNQDYVIPELQAYKLLMATRLCDVGQFERALAYTEQAARALTRSPHPHPHAARLAPALAALADRLQYHDPALQPDAPPEEPDSGEPSPRHQQWLHDVKSLALHVQSESTQQSMLGTPQHDPTFGQPQPQQHQLQPQQPSWPDPAVQYQQPVPTYNPEPPEEAPDYAAQYYAQQAQQAPQHQQQQLALAEPDPLQYGGTYGDDWQRTDDRPAPSYADPYWQPDSGYGYGESCAPSISMPGAPRPREPSPDARDQQQSDDETEPQNKTQKQETKNKEENRNESKRTAGGGGGWLGGILNKLSLRPPNQMILPDDKNPTIVWDEQHKRWRNLDGDGSVSEQPPPPPPKLADLVNTIRSASPPLQPSGSGPVTTPPVSNIFKMQKGRHIKNSYVDVFNPRGAGGQSASPGGLPPAGLPASPLAPGPLPPPGPAPAFFVPAPTQGGIYDPTQMVGDTEQYQSGI